MTDPGRPAAPPRRDALITETVAMLVAGAREIVPIAALVTLPLVFLSSLVVLPGASARGSARGACSSPSSASSRGWS